MTEDTITVPAYCYGAMDSKEYHEFKLERKWKWAFNKEKFRKRGKRAIE